MPFSHLSKWETFAEMFRVRSYAGNSSQAAGGSERHTASGKHQFVSIYQINIYRETFYSVYFSIAYVFTPSMY